MPSGELSEPYVPRIKIHLSLNKLEPLKGQINCNGHKPYPSVMAICSNPFLATMIQVRANLETYNGTGRIKEVPATAFLIGTFKEFPLGNIKPQENAEYETTMAVTYAKLIVDGVEIFEIDVLENIYKVGMVDMLATFKKNTGA